MSKTNNTTSQHVTVVEMYLTTAKNELVYVKKLIGGQIVSGKTRDGKTYVKDISSLSIRDQHFLNNGFNIGII